MNKNTDYDKKQEADRLLDVLGELPDEMIAQANPDLQEKLSEKSRRKTRKKLQEKRRPFFRIRILAAAVLFFAVIGVCSLVQRKLPLHNTARQEKETEKEEDSQIANDGMLDSLKLTVVAYAARSQDTDDGTEDNTASNNAKMAGTPAADATVTPDESRLAGYDAVELTETKVNISEYSLAMSSSPAMPFSFRIESDGKDISVRVKTDGNGMLQKWDTSEKDGTWKLQSEGAKIKCKPDEVIYWSPKNGTADKVHLSVDIYSGEMRVEHKIIEITCNDKMTYQAQLLP